MDTRELENKLRTFKVWECNLNLDKVKIELNQIFTSSNPLSFYTNFTNIKDNFSSFMSCLSNTIVSWFSMWDKNQNLIMYIYKNSSYDKVWYDLTKEYLKQSKYFNNDIYNLYMKLSSNWSIELDFNKMSVIILAIIDSYSFNNDRIDLYNFVNLDCFEWVKIKLDDILKKYSIYRLDFNVLVNEILSDLNDDDRLIFKKYINIEIIDNYFPDVRLLFYPYSSNNFLDKNTFNRIHWRLRVKNIDSEFSKYMNSQIIELLELKEMILSLNKNVLSNFILPIVYNLLAEKLSIWKKDLDKMRYLLLNIFASNYSEYKQIFMFFNQLEVFLNYNKTYSYFDKIKVSFSLVIFVTVLLLISYFYLPIWIFLWAILLLGIKSYELLNPESYFRWQLNIWLKFFAIMFMSISWYYWLQNMDDIKSDAKVLTDKIEILWKLETHEVFKWWYDFIKANVLEIKK